MKKKDKREERQEKKGRKEERKKILEIEAETPSKEMRNKNMGIGLDDHLLDDVIGYISPMLLASFYKENQKQIDFRKCESYAEVCDALKILRIIAKNCHQESLVPEIFTIPWALEEGHAQVQKQKKDKEDLAQMFGK